MVSYLSIFFIWVILPFILVAIASLLIIGMGWVLTTFLPFTLFEAALISALGAVALLGGYYRTLANFMGLNSPFSSDDDEWDNEWDDDDDWDEDDDWDAPHQAYLVAPSVSEKKTTKRGRRGKK